MDGNEEEELTDGQDNDDDGLLTSPFLSPRVLFSQMVRGLGVGMLPLDLWKQGGVTWISRNGRQ